MAKYLGTCDFRFKDDLSKDEIRSEIELVDAMFELNLSYKEIAQMVVQRKFTADITESTDVEKMLVYLQDKLCAGEVELRLDDREYMKYEFVDGKIHCFFGYAHIAYKDDGAI